MTDADTIVALATPAGTAARAIVRTSGPNAFAMATHLGATPKAGEFPVVALCLRELEIPARLLAFRGPRSHTGEDVVEYHVPGSGLIVRLLLEALRSAGGRDARPGEFTARAYFNGKLRLDEAEAVQAAVAATNDAELAAAARLREGELARRLAPPMDALAHLLALCEAGIDFVDEPDIVAIDPAEARQRIKGLLEALQALQADSARFSDLSRPPTIALVGPPNAGKSTLVNRLAAAERVVVAPTAGTTRDAIRVDIKLPGGRAVLLDLPGLADTPADALDAAAQVHAIHSVREADVLVLVQAANALAASPVLPRPPDLAVTTKSDLAPGDVSARTGDNIDWLRERLDSLAFGRHGGDRLALTTRHLAALADTRTALTSALDVIDGPPELLAFELRIALDHLGGILGTVAPDDLLARIFSTFCVGK